MSFVFLSGQPQIPILNLTLFEASLYQQLIVSICETMLQFSSFKLDVKYALKNEMSKDFIVDNIKFCACYPGTKNYSLVGQRFRHVPLASWIFFGRFSPKSKVVRGLPASQKECKSFYKLFLILSLFILLMEKFTCPSIIVYFLAKDRRSFY